jgi:TRAP-type uncharacterized transport system substrate-binding protein
MLTALAPPQIRAITGLELAAGIFTKCSEDLATQLSISLGSGRRDARRPELRVGINGDIYGGMRAPVEIGKRRVDIGYVNPAALVTMAYRGRGYYKQKMQLRVLGCFPSWDRIAIVVAKELGLRSLYDVAQRKIPLHVSTRMSGVNNGTYYTIGMILSFYGLSFDKIKRWGGKVQECARPFAPERMKAIAKRSIDAVFDEGVSTPGGWLDLALENDYEVISLEPEIVRKLELLGYTRTVLPKSRFRQLKRDALTIDYSGWALVTHRWFPDKLAYAAVETIDQKKNVMPIDDESPLDMIALCNGSEKCPLPAPLHPGAAKYYREHGYLK